MNDKIDLVIAWVDDSDEEWIKEKNKYSNKKIDVENSIIRYRDLGTLKYLFRGIEKFAPWINKIHFVTYGHIPKWLNVENPKINIVCHKDYIDEEFLPTFSSRPIELNLHRIKGLSDKFIYFNDDMFFIDKVKPSDFFKKGYPKYAAICDSLRADKTNDKYAHNILNASIIINNHFNKRKEMIKHLNKWFSIKYGKYNLKNILNFPYKECSRLCNFHMPYPYLKKTFSEVWNEENEILNETCKNKIRTIMDVNQTIFWYWAIFKNEFYPQKIKMGKYYGITDDNSKIVETITKQKCKIICINDTYMSENVNFESVKNEIKNAFETILNEKCSYEK